MSKRKHGLGLLGLLAVSVLGVMVFASSALALVPKFLTNGTLVALATIEGEQEGIGILLVSKLNTEIKCEKGAIKGMIKTGEDAEVSSLFEECTVLEITEPLAELPCHVVDTQKASALLHITVLNALLKPVEFSDGSLGILAFTSGVFVNFLSGTGCPLPLKTELKGSVCAKITAGNNTKEPLVQLSETIQKAAGCQDKLLYGLQEAFIDGSAKGWVLTKIYSLGVLLD